MKKALSIILAAVMLLGCMSVTAFAADSDFTIVNGVLTAYTGAATSVVIPSGVTSIGDHAFDGNTTITSVKIPSGVISIGNYAFNECSSLTSVTLPSTLTTIGEFAFYDCYELTDVTIPDHVTTIGDYAFTFCESLTSMTVPNGVTYLGEAAFADCRGITSVTIPNSVTSIRDYLFDHCYALTDLTVSWTDSIPTVSSYVFNDDRDKFLSNVTLHVPAGTTDAYGASDWAKYISTDRIIEATPTFITTFPLSKDYFDKYSTTDPKAKTDAVTDTVTFTITPITADAPTFGTVTVNVAFGVGSTDVTLPTYDKAGEYWYSITESAGNTAGVTYDTTSTYYLHVIVDNESGVFGVRSAMIHLTDSTDYDPEDASDKIEIISNEYGEGTLTVTENVTFNGEESDDDTAEFTETVTFTLPEGKEITGDVTYTDSDGEHTITPEMWSNGTYTVDITLKNGDSVTFNGLPDGTTYTVSQKTADEAFDLESVAFDNADETGDSVTSNVANGTIGDAADTVTITNAGFTPLDVGVILENGAFIILALGAIALGVWLVIVKRKNRESVDAE